MSFVGQLLDRLRSEPGVEYTHLRLDEGAPAAALQPDTQYLRVWLRSARITEVRRWTARFHASVHARFEVGDALQGRREVVCVVAPDQAFAEIDPRHLDRLVTVNRPLLGPVPWRGELATDVGLFSVSASDLAKPYLDLLADLTAAAGVSFLAKAVPWAEPLRRGAELLFAEAARAQLEIGLSRTDTALQPGHWLVARAPKGSLPAGLRLDPHDFGLLDAQGRPVTGIPYMVIGIEALDQRDDYAAIPDIRAAWDGVRNAVAEGRPDDEVRQRYAQLRRVIAVSPELVSPDKRRVAELFAHEVREAGYALPTTAPSLPAQPGAPGPLAQPAGTPRGLATRRPRRLLAAPEQLLSPERVVAAGDDQDDAAPLHADCDAHDEDDHDQDHQPPMRPQAPVGSAAGAARSAPRPWRIAGALLALRDTVNTLAPLRSKRSDGAIGDAAHASRSSDHNPWVVAGGKGIVTAVDITHDPAGGCDAHRLAEALRAGRDSRIKYVIWNRRIFSATVQPWTWRPYGGSNPHDHHLHVSVAPEPGRFDDATHWQVEV